MSVVIVDEASNKALPELLVLAVVEVLVVARNVEIDDDAA